MSILFVFQLQSTWGRVGTHLQVSPNIPGENLTSILLTKTHLTGLTNQVEVTRGGDLVSWAQVLKGVSTSPISYLVTRCFHLYLFTRWVASSQWHWGQTGDTFGCLATSWLIRSSLEILSPSSLAGELHYLNFFQV